MLSRSHPLRVITVTCVLDGRAHEVDEDAMTAPSVGHAGRYPARCGHLVTAAPMVAPIGRPCRACRAMTTGASRHDPDQVPAGRHRRSPRRWSVTRRSAVGAPA